MKTDSDYKQDQRKRDKAAGLVRLELRVPAKHVEKIKTFARGLQNEKN